MLLALWLVISTSKYNNATFCKLSRSQDDAAEAAAIDILALASEAHANAASEAVSEVSDAAASVDVSCMTRAVVSEVAHAAGQAVERT